MTNYDAWLKQATWKFRQAELRDPTNERFLWMADLNYSDGLRYGTDGYRAHLIGGEKQAGDGDHAVNWRDIGRIEAEDAKSVTVCTVLHIVKACQNALAFVGTEKDRSMRVSLNGAMEFAATNAELGSFNACLKAGTPYETWKGNYPHLNPFVYYHTGEDVTFRIDAGFLRAALLAYPLTSLIKIMLQSPHNAIYIQPFEWQGEQVPEAIIMPQMRK